ncbi:MAG TPA: BCD family MFS transporter [Gemmatimonadaceae bacterium]|nr:BCD family MFS transporter [Gemmatimonadaceae bacterium]
MTTAARAPLVARLVSRFGPSILPFADVATVELPLPRLLRLGLLQFTVALATTLLAGTLNRVMIVELKIPALVVGLMLAIPLLTAPFRALIGYRSDTHVSVLGWRRVPYIWFGTMMQFGGLAIMPIALHIMSGDTHGDPAIGVAASFLAFLCTGLGSHMVQTAGLALATDIAPQKDQPRVVALLYVMLLIGMVVASVGYGAMLRNFNKVVLIQVVQGAGALTLFLNIFAVWQQEARGSAPTRRETASRPPFLAAWREFVKESPQLIRLLTAVGVGTFAFTLQDVLLEPFGGQVLKLGVAATTLLTGVMATGAIASFAIAARRASQGADPIRLCAAGAVIGMFGFAAIILSSPMFSAALLMLGALLIGFGNGLFSIGTLLRVMALPHKGENGLALGAWGAVQATAAGLAMALAGSIRDGVTAAMSARQLSLEAVVPGIGYLVAYHLAVVGLLVLLVVLGPLAARRRAEARPVPFGIAEFPA